MLIKLLGLGLIPLSHARCNTVRLKSTIDDERNFIGVRHPITLYGTMFYIYCREYHMDYNDRPIMYELLPDGCGREIEEEPDEC